jgi:hypothetical protein
MSKGEVAVLPKLCDVASGLALPFPSLNKTSRAANQAEFPHLDASLKLQPLFLAHISSLQPAALLFSASCVLFFLFVGTLFSSAHLNLFVSSPLLLAEPGVLAFNTITTTRI